MVHLRKKNAILADKSQQLFEDAEPISLIHRSLSLFQDAPYGIIETRKRAIMPWYERESLSPSGVIWSTATTTAFLTATRPQRSNSVADIWYSTAGRRAHWEGYGFLRNKIHLWNIPESRIETDEKLNRCFNIMTNETWSRFSELHSLHASSLNCRVAARKNYLHSTRYSHHRFRHSRE